MPQHKGFLLIRRTGDEIRCLETPFMSFAHACRGAAITLEAAKLAGSANARLFGEALARRPIGTVWGHPCGDDFRVLCADFTEDGRPILPGARLFNYYDAEWGIVEAEQFMSTGLLSPGGEHFNHWYRFARESDGFVRELNGQRLATREPRHARG